MDKNILNEAVQHRLNANESERNLAKYVFQTLYNELNQGQQKKMLKKEKVKELFDLYGMEYSV